jgi:hypothetical protein
LRRNDAAHEIPHVFIAVTRAMHKHVEGEYLKAVFFGKFF